MMVPSDRAAHMDVSAPCSATPSKFSFDTRALLGRHAVFVFAFLLCLVYAGKNLDRGWVPHDDGALAQSAERVLAGELPHRDFVEIYSGALDYLHALSFLLFGKTLISMRLMLLAAYLLWLPVVYRIALYFADRITAAASTVLAGVWSIPFYSAPMPSWYNLFFASLAILCLLRFQQDPSRKVRWIFLAGFCCGLSIIVKITGVYAFAAALLACVYFAQAEAKNKARSGNGSPGYAAFVVVSLALFVLSVVRLLGDRIGVDGAFAFVVPCFVVVALLAAIVVKGSSGSSDRTHFVALVRLLVPVLLGAALPVCIFVFPYLVTHSMGALIRGVFLLPFRRVGVTVINPSTILATIPAALLVLVLWAATYVRQRAWSQIAICAGLLYGFVRAAHNSIALPFFWLCAFDIVPYYLVAVAALVIWKGPFEDGVKAQIYVLSFFIACCNLSRFPFSHQIYFCYIAPLVFLGILALLSATPRRNRVALWAVCIFYIVFAVYRVKPGFVPSMGYLYAESDETVAFKIDRAHGIHAQPATVAEYENVVRTVLQRSHSDFIYAGPDSPEIYFLAGKKNPTPDIFDFLDEQATVHIENALDRYPIRVVVVKRKAQFSSLDRSVDERLQREFPHLERYERFDVRWK